MNPYGIRRCFLLRVFIDLHVRIIKVTWPTSISISSNILLINDRLINVSVMYYNEREMYVNIRDYYHISFVLTIWSGQCE